MQIGDKLERTCSFNADQVREYAALIRDYNKLHLDPEAARRSRFGRCIVHGWLTSGLFSGLMAELIPGGAYMDSAVKFLAPVYVDEEITASATVVAVTGNRVTFDLLITGDRGEAVSGSARVVVLEDVEVAA